MRTPRKISTEQLLLAAGISLIPALPLGIWIGISWLFCLFVFFHLFFVFWACTSGLQDLWQWTEEAEINKLLIFGIFALFFAWISVENILPITARDALVHHLAVPKWWVAAGYIIPTTWHEWSNYPMLIQLVFTAFEVLRITFLSPYYHALFLFLLAVISGELAGRLSASKKAPIVTALIIISACPLLRLATQPLVDLPLAVYSTMALLGAVTWIQNRNNKSLSNSGFSLGLAASIKPNGIVSGGIFTTLFAIELIRKDAKFFRFLKSVAILVGCAGVLFFPWAIKNYAWIGNPTFPFLRGIFGPNSQSALTTSFSPIDQRMMLYNENILDLVLLPFRVFVTGVDDNPARFDGAGVPILLFGLLGFFFIAKTRPLKFVYFYSVLYLLIAVYFGPTRVRYLLPIFGSLAALATVVVIDLEVLSQRFFKAKILLPIVLLGHFIFTGVYLSQFPGTAKALKYIRGEYASDDEYLSQSIPEYPVIQFANQYLDTRSKTYLLLTGNLFYLYNYPTIAAGHMSADELLIAIRNAKSPDDIKSFFYSRQVTHLLANVILAQRVWSESLTSEELTRWATFVDDYLILSTQSHDFALWEIK